MAYMSRQDVKDAIKQNFANEVTRKILEISEQNKDFTIEDFEYILNAITISVREQIVRKVSS